MQAMSLIQRLLSPIVEVRREEAGPLLLMFIYSFLVMSAYNIVKPLTRAQFIQELGADNLPWVLVVSGVLVGVVMQLYSRGISLLPPRLAPAATQIGVGLLLVGFWVLFRTDAPGASVLFYFSGQILGVLLISQFWTLANDIYDARQAKRLFGFIGGGASLGGITASALVAFAVDRTGADSLLIVSGGLLFVCAGVATAVTRLSGPVTLTGVAAEEKGIGGRETFRLLRESRHLQIIALIIGFAAIGAGLLDQQLNMAVEEAAGAGGASSIAAFLGQVQLYLSVAGFVIQIWLTSRVHRYLGVGFAILILPIGLGATGGLILVTGALWAAATGRVLDASLRYTVDKTTREILFLPLPADLRRQAKPFIDVTVDRFAKGIGAALTLILIQPWGLGLSWPQLSWVSLTITALWIAGAVKAHRRYLASFRESIAHQHVRPTEVRLNVADLSTVETLIEELAHPDEKRVLYAIEMLESLDKQNLISPLLLHHASTKVRVRALGALSAARADIAGHWATVIERLITDPDPELRTAAVGALANLRNEDALAIARTLIDDADPRIVATAAVVLSNSNDADDLNAAERALSAIIADTRESANGVRRDLAGALRQTNNLRFHGLLIPLLRDPDPGVTNEAMRSIRELDVADLLFAPALVSLLGNRRLKSGARATLVCYGEPVVEVLKHFLENPAENVWVRRHIPATLARIPCQASIDALAAALETDDRFLRFKVLAAIEKLRHEHPSLAMEQEPIERLALAEGRAYFARLGLHYDLFERARLPRDGMLSKALMEKIGRSVDRIYRLLGLLYSWKDVAAARWSIEHGDSRERAGALEYLDNVLSSTLRGQLIPVLEESPLEQKVKRGHALLKTRPRGVEETLLELFEDDDPVVAALAVAFVGERELWGLGPAVERLATRPDGPHRYVADAASWALASRNLTPEQRRERWIGSLPAVMVVDRMRDLPLFESVGIDELFRIAGAGGQTRHDAGATFFEAGSPPDRLYLLLDGEAVATGQDNGERHVAAPAALGFEEALDGRLMAETIKTTGAAVTLSLGNDELRTLLADNTDLVRGLFRTLAVLNRASSELHRARGEFRTLVALRSPGAESVAGAAPAALGSVSGQGLTDVQKGPALRLIPLFAKVTGVEMLHLAAIATQVALDTSALFTDETSPPCLAIVLSGELGMQASGGARTVARAVPGDVVGMYETLVGAGQIRLAATQPSSVLKIDREDLFDLLGQRPDLLQQIFAAIFDRGV